MVRRQGLSAEQRRLLRITGRMPLASVSNLAPICGMVENRMRELLNGLRRDEWVASASRGMTEGKQNRWFLTRRAVEELYATDSRPSHAPGGGADGGPSARFHREWIIRRGIIRRSSGNGLRWSTWTGWRRRPFCQPRSFRRPCSSRGMRCQLMSGRLMSR